MKALQFRLSGVPVRIEPFFFLAIAFLGWAYGNTGAGIAVFMVVGGASLLLHEMGHATAFKSFGAHPTVTLHGFGGYTLGPQQPRSRSLIVSLAGPGAGFVGALVGVLLARVVPPGSEVVDKAIEVLKYVNLLWGGFNLLPILPLDGGHVAADLFGMRNARYLSVAGAVALGALAIGVLHAPFLAIFAFMFASQNVGALRAERDRPQLQQLDEARGLMLEGRNAEAVEKIEAAGAKSESWPVEVTSAELLAWVRLAEGQPDEARAALDRLRGGATKTSLLVQRMVALAEGNQKELLAPAFVNCDDIVAATIASRMVTAGGLLDRVLEEMRTLPPLPGPPRNNGYRVLQLGLHHAGRYRDAARVGEILFKALPDPLVAYNAACSSALAGEPTQALAWLDRAVEHGFRDTALLDRDNNFDSIRDTDGFRAVRSWMEADPTGGEAEKAADA